PAISRYGRASRRRIRAGPTDVQLKLNTPVKSGPDRIASILLAALFPERPATRIGITPEIRMIQIVHVVMIVLLAGCIFRRGEHRRAQVLHRRPKLRRALRVSRLKSAQRRVQFIRGWLAQERNLIEVTNVLVGGVREDVDAIAVAIVVVALGPV